MEARSLGRRVGLGPRGSPSGGSPSGGPPSGGPPSGGPPGGGPPSGGQRRGAGVSPVMTASGPLLAATQTSVQWQTLAWIIGAGVTAAVIIAIIVLVSRRPRSVAHGIEGFSRSLRAVAPSHRS